MTEYITKSRDRLDRICYAQYGTTLYRVVENVIAANPGLETHGITLPMGLKITFPPLSQVKSEPKVGKQIFLWN